MFQFDLNNLLSVRSLVCLFVVLLPRLSYTLLYPSISERARKKRNFFHRRFFAFPSARFLSNRIHYSWMAELWVSFLTSFAFPSSKCWQIYSILKIMYFHSVLYSFCVVCLNLLTEQQASHFVHPYIRAHTMGIIIWKQACHTCLLHSHSISPLPLSLSLFFPLYFFRCRSFSLLVLANARHRPHFIQALHVCHLFYLLLKQKYPMYYIYHENEIRRKT